MDGRETFHSLDTTICRGGQSIACCEHFYLAFTEFKRYSYRCDSVPSFSEWRMMFERHVSVPTAFFGFFRRHFTTFLIADHSNAGQSSHCTHTALQPLAIMKIGHQAYEGASRRPAIDTALAGPVLERTNGIPHGAASARLVRCGVEIEDVMERYP